jgi:protein-disulfide isomerase
MKKLTLLSFLILTLSACSSGRLEANISGPADALQSSVVEFQEWTEDDPIWGEPDAPLKIVVFSDLQCPFCAHFVETINSLEQEWIDTGKLAVQYREFPLRGHKNGLTSAQAVGAANLQGQFWEMHNKLYQTQSVWGESDDAYPIFESYAKEMELDLKQFKADYESSEVAMEAIDDLEAGQEAGVAGTPTWFLNGEIFKGNLLEDSMKELLETMYEGLPHG